MALCVIVTWGHLVDRQTEMIEDIIFPQLRWWVVIHGIHHMKVSFLGLFMKNSVAQKQFRKPKFIIIWQQSVRLSHITYHRAKEKFFHCMDLKIGTELQVGLDIYTAKFQRDKLSAKYCARSCNV